MPLSDNIKVVIAGQEMEVESTYSLPVAISYKLEDRDDFQKKKSSEALSIAFPATKNNSIVSNSYHNPSIEDLTADTAFRNERPAVISANGIELLSGKAFLKNGKHKDVPTQYEYDLYGNNADWMLDLQDATLYDFLKHITFAYTKAHITDSWTFDGTDESLPYVFAPVRYGEAFDTLNVGGTDIPDYNVRPDYLRPSISKYWIIYWALKSVGYRIESPFFSTPFFRRQVMPWSWGNFLFSEGTRLDIHNFLAKSVADVTFYATSPGRDERFIDLNIVDTLPGTFDNNNDYTYDAINFEAKWQYKTPDFGLLNANFYANIYVDADCNGNGNGNPEVALQAVWFKNGVEVHRDQLVQLTSDGDTDVGFKEVFFSSDVVNTDVISLKLYGNIYRPGFGIPSIIVNVVEFKLDYFRQTISSTIDFANYTALKKAKLLDFMRGVIDEFNISVQTDSTAKVVYMEPTHPYSTTNNLATRSNGYFNEDFIDWTDKQDLSKESSVENFNDNERELFFKYKDDTNDGLLKLIQDRNATVLAQGKYVLPSRFKKGKQEIENRFFSPVMHYDVEQWKGIKGAAPQMVCMVPENISNTSRAEAQNTFTPKSCYYKGLTSAYGWVFDGDSTLDYPFMFAVNYKPGGENDPVLSYSDERIGEQGSYTVAKGLLRRFYLQRMAIMRNGQYYDPCYFKLNNYDVANFLHREHIIAAKQRWELVEINQYQPVKEESTKCFMRKWVPVAQVDSDSVYPQAATVTGSVSTDPFEIKYSPLKCLASDIATH